MAKIDVLKSLRLGQRVAEEESESLEDYFVETNQWNEIFDGEKDLVFGPKGSGKSALYALLNKRSDALLARNILISAAENPNGATVFTNLITNPPPSEIAFTLLWKVYSLTLIAECIRNNQIESEYSSSLINALSKLGLLSKSSSRGGIFSSVRTYVSKLFDRNVSSIESTITFDPSTGLPLITGKIDLESDPSERAHNIPVEELLSIANKALQKSNKKVWILFDRLDVAFSENSELEKNALRALFRAYRDMRSFPNIWLKLFIRDDVWSRITSEGFAEASHLTRSTRIEWDESGLRNLLIRRLANNNKFLLFTGRDQQQLLDNAEDQKNLLEEIFPDKIDIGRNPKTFDWMVSRVADGSKKSAPRELIHLLDEVRLVQIKRIEEGETIPQGGLLFDRPVFKQALRDVSRVRYEQTFRPENPSVVKYTEALRSKKSEQTVESLASLWDCSILEAKEIAEKLASFGFFEKRTSKEGLSYWVPFLYRDALDLIQGMADL